MPAIPELTQGGPAPALTVWVTVTAVKNRPRRTRRARLSATWPARSEGGAWWGDHALPGHSDQSSRDGGDAVLLTALAVPGPAGEQRTEVGAPCHLQVSALGQHLSHNH